MKRLLVKTYDFLFSFVYLQCDKLFSNNASGGRSNTSSRHVLLELHADVHIYIVILALTFRKLVLSDIKVSNSVHLASRVEEFLIRLHVSVESVVHSVVLAKALDRSVRADAVLSSTSNVDRCQVDSVRAIVRLNKNRLERTAFLRRSLCTTDCKYFRFYDFQLENLDFLYIYYKLELAFDKEAITSVEFQIKINHYNFAIFIMFELRVMQLECFRTRYFPPRSSNYYA